MKRRRDPRTERIVARLMGLVGKYGDAREDEGIPTGRLTERWRCLERALRRALAAERRRGA